MNRMESDLRELVERWSYSGKWVNVTDEEAIRHSCAAELEAVLDANDDDEPIPGSDDLEGEE